MRARGAARACEFPDHRALFTTRRRDRHYPEQLLLKSDDYEFPLIHICTAMYTVKYTHDNLLLSLYV